MKVQKNRDVTFITTTLNTKWLNYQQSLLKKLFPEMPRLIINGSNNWPYVWYNWLGKCHNVETKYIALVDEDFFIFNKDAFYDMVEFIKKSDYDISGVSDGYHHYRQQNPVALNSFFNIIKTESLFSIIKKQTFTDRHFKKTNIQKYFSVPLQTDFLDSWASFEYPHTKFADAKITNKNFEPYYPFYWTLLNNGFKFHYLYPHFDNVFMSTNPRLNSDSPDVGNHMWYTRNWNDPSLEVHGMKNNERYSAMEKKILSFL